MGYTPGQVLGGRWKPLHHLMASHLYRDVISVCGAAGSCYARSDDALAPFAGAVALSLLRFSTSAVTPLKSVPVALPRGAAAFAYFCLGSGDPAAACQPVAEVLAASGCSPADCALLVDPGAVPCAAPGEVCGNFQLLAPPAQLRLPRAHVTAALGGETRADGAVRVDLAADAFALYVWLSCGAQGRFEDNFFALRQGARSVWFLPGEGFDAAELAATLRVEHVAMYQ